MLERALLCLVLRVHCWEALASRPSEALVNSGDNGCSTLWTSSRPVPRTREARGLDTMRRGSPPPPSFSCRQPQEIISRQRIRAIGPLPLHREAPLRSFLWPSRTVGHNTVSTQSKIEILASNGPLKGIQQSSLCPSQHQRQTDRQTVQHNSPFFFFAPCLLLRCSKLPQKPPLRAPPEPESPPAIGEDQTALAERNLHTLKGS